MYHKSSKWLDRFLLGPGDEQEVTVILDWNRQGVKKDWSVTAWGTGGKAVSVKHTHGIESDKMP